MAGMAPLLNGVEYDYGIHKSGNYRRQERYD
jgi:hypothetical protein